MILFPNAKINLGLHVLSKRSDGFHNLETCFYPVPWYDILEIIPSESLAFTSSGNAIPGNQEDNLCIKAYHTLAADHSLPPVHIHLHKNIPIGAGLGGGSSDAAFVCTLLNQRFQLGLTNRQLEQHVRPLGSDCAFFIQNKAIVAHEKGDMFSDQGIVNLKDWWICLIHPSIHVSTKEAYAGVIPQENRKPLTSILRLPVEQWKNELVNDFETSV
ncbi:MAG: 4-(cytidine 5'-diphospho)-2-C-methyl-D-erythritol kinase, partial [Cytophagales bacterium]|nr:4-(cytidine 5'-diphospho)-2-C-methyl-D-erythritol kinase [Cytophaga sp.]